MSSPDVLRYIYDLQQFGIKFGLLNTRQILKAIGDPHLGLNVIHVAGTNGKGSTASMVSAILKSAGYRVGLYTSPHLVDLSERFQINGTPISKERLTREAGEIKRAIDHITFSESYPTYFEALTCLAFSYFSKEQVDFAIMEVGMGGRLDATNVCMPRMAVITNISLDHQEYLGNTLDEIAGEKAGIIKPGCPVVCGVEEHDIMTVIAARCRAMDATLYNISELYNYKEVFPVARTTSYAGKDPAKDKWGMDINGDISPINPEKYQVKSERVVPKINIYRNKRHYLTIKTALQGRFQIKNILTVLEVIERLKAQGITIDKAMIREGLRHTTWPGRMQLISRRPFMILDGAHNPEAAASIMEAIKAQFKYRALILVLGILRDKDILGICNALISRADKIILTSPKYKRASSVEELQEIIKDHIDIEGKECLLVPEITGALKMAKEIASREDLILVTGSLYTVGEAMWGLGIKPYPAKVRVCA